MERERELVKLINVVRRTGRLATDAMWDTGTGSAEATYCAETYNRVLKRLREHDEGVVAIFDPLPPDSSLAVVAMACRQLAAYYEDEVPERLEARPSLNEEGRRSKLLAAGSAKTDEQRASQ